MPTFINRCLRVAEDAAEHIIKLKDVVLGSIVNVIIPNPDNRAKFRAWFVQLPAPSFPRLSQRLDELVEDGTITLPNALSLSRIPAGMFFLASYLSGFPIEYPLSAVVWAIISDFFDGVLARVLKQETTLGAGLDALCDKVFAGCCAISLLPYLWWWNFGLFVLLDSMLAALGWALYRAKQRGTYHGQAQVKANWLGKFKFCCQGLACLVILLFQATEIGNWFLAIANAFAVGSLIRHLEPKQRAT